jgi:hypothetical protein
MRCRILFPQLDHGHLVKAAHAPLIHLHPERAVAEEAGDFLNQRTYSLLDRVAKRGLHRVEHRPQRIYLVTLVPAPPRVVVEQQYSD